MSVSLKKLLTGSLLAAALGIVACSVSQDEQILSQEADAATGNQTEQGSASEQSAEKSQLTNKLSLIEAVAIAEASTEGKVYALEREIEDNIPVVEVELGEHEVLVNADTSEIVLIENQRETGDQDDIEEVDEALGWQEFATISIQEALEIAENHAGAEAHTAELSNEEGNLVYEVVIGLNAIYVDAGNGKVLLAETDGEDSNSIDFQSSVQVPYHGEDGDDD